MSFTPTQPFRPAVGLAGPHAQTIFANLARPAARPPLTRERWDTPDADFVDVDSFDGRPGAPHVVVLHGLEGSSRAGYVAAVLRGAAARGWGASALNFRSCSGAPNLQLRLYHSGETTDARWVLARLRARVKGPLVAVGFSLGGNVLCRLLEEDGARTSVVAAVAVSVPYDLAACARQLDAHGGVHAIYRARFLRSLKAKARAKARRFPGAFDVARMEAARGVWEFDDVVTGPVHGFRDAAHYYAESSSGPHLGDIRVPTLLLSAEDDPMVPGPVVPPSAHANPQLTVVTTAHGGHVGFVAGSPVRPHFWGDAQALAFLDATLRG